MVSTVRTKAEKKNTLRTEHNESAVFFLQIQIRRYGNQLLLTRRQISEIPHFRIPENPDNYSDFEHPNMYIFGSSDFRISGNLDFEESRFANSGNPNIRMSRKPNMPIFGNPNFRISGNPDFPESRCSGNSKVPIFALPDFMIFEFPRIWKSG